MRTTETKIINFHLSKNVGKSLKDEIDSIINHKELLAGHAIKTRLHNCCPNLVMQRVLMNKENSKMNESHIFGLNL